MDIGCYIKSGFLWRTPLFVGVGLAQAVVSDYGLDDRAIGVQSRAGAKDFSSNLCVQTVSGAHPASCTMGTGDPFPEGKNVAGAWRWPLTPSSAEVDKE
jgi:hypothetical protein